MVHIFEGVAKWRLRRLTISRSKAVSDFEEIEARYEYFLGLSVITPPSDATYQQKVDSLRQRSIGAAQTKQLLPLYLKAKNILECIDSEIDMLEKFLKL